MKISKPLASAHRQALDLVHSDRPLNYEDRLFVIENYHEGATHINGLAGAFFTPISLARDFAINVGGGDQRRIVDLCAGSGRLGFAIDWEGRHTELTCVEINPEYVMVGRRVLPHAEWILADCTETALRLPAHFDFAVSNPPFGRVATRGRAQGRYTGPEMEFRVIDAASRIARHGAFVLPQASCPFRYSGRQTYERVANAKYDAFRAETGIDLDIGVAVDTAAYRAEWRGTNPICEIVVCDFNPQIDASQSLPPERSVPGLAPRQLELV